MLVDNGIITNDVGKWLEKVPLKTLYQLYTEYLEFFKKYNGGERHMNPDFNAIVLEGIEIRIMDGSNLYTLKGIATEESINDEIHWQFHRGSEYLWGICNRAAKANIEDEFRKKLLIYFEDFIEILYSDLFVWYKARDDYITFFRDKAIAKSIWDHGVSKAEGSESNSADKASSSESLRKSLLKNNANNISSYHDTMKAAFEAEAAKTKKIVTSLISN